MSTHTHHRTLIALTVTVLVVLTAATALATPSSPSMLVGPTDQFDAQAVVIRPSADTQIVYVATGENFPDALGAGPAAGMRNAPVLLVKKNSVPDATRAELQRLNPHAIAIVGGTAVISPSVENTLKDYTTTVYRLSGTDRYETAAKVSKSSFPAAHGFAVYDTSVTSILLDTSCKGVPDLEVPVTAPVSGTIIVQAGIGLGINHTKGPGHSAYAQLFLVPSPTDCTSAKAWGGDIVDITMRPEPTGHYSSWYTLRKILHVNARTTTKFYITGKLIPGDTDPVSVRAAYVDAQFIPDPGT